jgi:hypothetical protein
LQVQVIFFFKTFCLFVCFVAMLRGPLPPSLRSVPKSIESISDLEENFRLLQKYFSSVEILNNVHVTAASDPKCHATLQLQHDLLGFQTAFGSASVAIAPFPSPFIDLQSRFLSSAGVEWIEDFLSRSNQRFAQEGQGWNYGGVMSACNLLKLNAVALSPLDGLVPNLKSSSYQLILALGNRETIRLEGISSYSFVLQQHLYEGTVCV